MEVTEDQVGRSSDVELKLRAFLSIRPDSVPKYGFSVAVAVNSAV